MPVSYVSPGLLLAKKIKGSVTSRLSVPVVVNTPLTVKSPTTTRLPPTLTLEVTPTPPDTISAPVPMLPLCVVFVTRT